MGGQVPKPLETMPAMFGAVQAKEEELRLAQGSFVEGPESVPPIRFPPGFPSTLEPEMELEKNIPTWMYER